MAGTDRRLVYIGAIAMEGDGGQLSWLCLYSSRSV